MIAIAPSIGHHVGSPPRSELNLDEPPSVYSPACVMVPAGFGQALSAYSLASPDILAISGQAHQTTLQHGVEVSANMCKPLPPSIGPAGLDRPMEAFLSNLVRRSCRQCLHSLFQNAGRAPVRLAQLHFSR